MKKLLLILPFLFLAPLTASAHFLKTDGDIGVVLHIDPKDDPIAGQPATAFFDIKDKTGAFQPADCNCIVTVSSNGAEQASESASVAGSGVTSNLTLADPGVYTVKLQGEPYVDGAFKPFQVSWDIRAEKGGASSASTGFLASHWIHLALILVATAYFIYRLRIDKRNDMAKAAARKKA